MANFRVAHLSLRQTDVGAAGAQFRPRIILVELVVNGRRREQRGISVLFALVAAGWIDTPAIANDEHHWASHTLPALWR